MSRTTRIRMKLESLESRRVLTAMSIMEVDLPSREFSIVESVGSISGEAAYTKELDFDGDGDVDGVDLLASRKEASTGLETKPVSSAIFAEQVSAEQGGKAIEAPAAEFTGVFETSAYGKLEGERGYLAGQDFDGDGDIDGIDLLKYRSEYVQSPVALPQVKPGLVETPEN